MLRTIFYSNCYDLGVLTSLACDALGYRPNPQNNATLIHVLSCSAMAGRPWGYITDGPLFGYATDISRQCNNPFWDSNPSPDPNTPWHLDRNNPLRTSFSSHCFAIFRAAANNALRIIDVCHGSIDVNNVISIFAGHLGAEPVQGPCH
ncbi:hypothetical protein B0T22DRAFT_452129 [Podospora appendiculata]|uniref:Uncharacterized protein n=1 Tax=Podospora appendiculata TaxID=314037 RepID=A0AAE0XIX9_9PEZI|nr:hypothetical protein B0T22DRAFT_452129 [Podospora appendiculata]